MADKTWTTVAVRKTVLKRLLQLKQHPKETHTDIITRLLDSNDKKQVKLNDIAQT